jgi:LPS sulfotransferase NodH
VGFVRRARDYIEDRAVRRGWRRGWREYRRFVVLSHYRSGSNLFLSLLRSHPNVVCHSELFSPPRIYWGSGIHGGTAEDPELLRLRGEDPAAFLDRTVFRPYARRIRAVGFKLMYTHAEKEHRFPGLKALLLADPDLCFIQVKRRNLLRMLVSLRVTEQTGAMSSTSEADSRRRLDAARPIRLTEGECREHFEWITAFWRDWDERTGLEVFYEDLAADAQSQLDRTFDVLDLPSRPVRSPLVKQTTKPLRDILENYEALERAFANSEWAALFDG